MKLLGHVHHHQHVIVMVVQEADSAQFSLDQLIKMAFIQIHLEVHLIYRRMLFQTVDSTFVLPEITVVVYMEVKRGNKIKKKFK